MQYAFWRYDQFPYFNGGTIEEMSKEGAVLTKEYGYGRWFQPVLILPLVAGLELQRKLDLLTKQHRAAVAKLDLDFRAELAKAAPNLPQLQKARRR